MQRKAFSLIELLVTFALACIVFGAVAISSNISIRAWLSNKHRAELVTKGENAMSRMGNELASATTNIVTVAPCDTNECVGNKLLFKTPITDPTQNVNTKFTPDDKIKFGAYPRNAATGRQDAIIEYKVTPDGKLKRVVSYDPATTCLNGICDAGEDLTNCPQDCSICNDHQCTGPETLQTCPQDCAVCGDNICSTGETCASCPSDCCGDGHGCFLANTPIIMADGTQKPIQEIKAGDKVLGFNEKTKELTADTVVQLLVHNQDTDEFLIINNDLFVTKIHRFYVDRDWKAIGTMKVADKITKADLTTEAIKDIKRVKADSKLTTYNFSTQQYHNYFAGGFLVHNSKQQQHFE